MPHTWPKSRSQMQQLNLIEFFDKNGRILQHTELTANQLNILKKLKIKPPNPVLEVNLAAQIHRHYAEFQSVYIWLIFQHIRFFVNL